MHFLIFLNLFCFSVELVLYLSHLKLPAYLVC